MAIWCVGLSDVRPQIQPQVRHQKEYKKLFFDEFLSQWIPGKNSESKYIWLEKLLKNLLTLVVDPTTHL